MLGGDGDPEAHGAVSLECPHAVAGCRISRTGAGKSAARKTGNPYSLCRLPRGWPRADGVLLNLCIYCMEAGWEKQDEMWEMVTGPVFSP